MLSTILSEIAPDSIVVRNGTHYFRLQYTSDATLLSKETRVQPLYRPPCTQTPRCAPTPVPALNLTEGWILLCLSSEYNFLAEISAPLSAPQRQYPLLASIPCGPCTPAALGALEARIPGSSPSPSPAPLYLRGSTPSSEPSLKMNPSLFAGLVAGGTVALLLLLLGLLQLIAVPRKLKQAPIQ
jgi:hypothetical protein